MAQKIMYPAAANSPGTELVEDITAAQTTINVISGSALPDAPNLFTIGSDETAETVQYTGKSGNTLTGCTRGFDGTAAKGWSAGTKVARYFTAYDHDTFRSNITDLDGRVTSAKETADTAKATADKAETPTGAQQKADQALKDAKAHTTTVTDNMNKDYIRFSGWGGKTGGSGDVFTLSVTAGTTVLDGFGVSFEADRDSENPSLKVNQYDPYPIVADSVNKKPVKLVTGKVYSVRKSGGYFLLDSGSAAGGAAILGEEEIEGFAASTVLEGGMARGFVGDLWGSWPKPSVLPTYLNKVAFHPNEKIMAVVSGDSPQLSIYRIESNNTLTKLPNPPGLPNSNVSGLSVDFSPDGKFIAVGYALEDSPIRVWSINGETFTYVSLNVNTGNGATCVKFSPDSKYLIVGYGNGTSLGGYIIDSAGTFTRMNSPTSTPSPGVVDIAFRSNTEIVAVTTHSSASYAYKLSGSSFEFLTLVPKVDFSSHKSAVFLNEGKLLFTITGQSPKYHTIYDVSSDGKTYTAWSNDRIPDLPSNPNWCDIDKTKMRIIIGASSRLMGFSYNSNFGFILNPPRVTLSGDINGVAYSPQNKYFCSVGSNGNFDFRECGTVFEPMSGSPASMISSKEGAVYSYAYAKSRLSSSTKGKFGVVARH